MTTVETDLVAWLLDQVAVDERAARDGHSACAHVDLCDDGSEFDEVFGFRNGPARVLAECDAKWRIIADHKPVEVDGGFRCGSCGPCVDCAWDAGANEWPCITLRLLALPYADRPGYRQEWAP